MSKEQKDVIEHYKKKLVRNLEDSDKVLHCLKKLEAAPVTIEILTQTEVGKIVNRLKKNPDATKDVIKASKALVEKWKDLVKTTEENESKEVLKSVKKFVFGKFKMCNIVVRKWTTCQLIF